MSFNRDELRSLIELLCEERISQSQIDRLDEIVCSDPAALQFYVEYQSLHACLSWDTARTGHSDPVITVSAGTSTPQNAEVIPADQHPGRRAAAWGLLAALACCGVIVLTTGKNWWPGSNEKPIVPSQNVVRAENVTDSEVTKVTTHFE